MSDKVALRVELRHALIAENAALDRHGDGGAMFLALARPAPVRSVLALHFPDGVVQSFEVATCHERGGDERGQSGCVGRIGGAERLRAWGRVGSESLGSAAPAAAAAAGTTAELEPSEHLSNGVHPESGPLEAASARGGDGDAGVPLEQGEPGSGSLEASEAGGNGGRKRKGRKRD